VVDAAAPAPVVAAGGIADGRGIAAVLTLGAAGAWLGTRFLASREAAAHPRYKELVLRAAETDTLHSTLFDGGWPDAPQRTLRSATIRAWEAAGRPPRGARPGEGEVIAHDGQGRPILRYDDRIPAPDTEGDVEGLALYAGQSAGLVATLRPAGEIVGQLVAETVAALERAGRLLHRDAAAEAVP
jgi:NAD(P)H-dependent flavin oxidoreductase YrpB (nitropropane dioxygenase family)